MPQFGDLYDRAIAHLTSDIHECEDGAEALKGPIRSINPISCSWIFVCRAWTDSRQPDRLNNFTLRHGSQSLPIMTKKN